MTKLFVFSSFVWIGSLLISCGNKEQGNESAQIKDSTTEMTTSSQPIKTILFFGNSLTAGYGLEPDQAFPALLQRKIDSMKLPYKAVNAGVSGETSAGGNGRIDWLLKSPVDVFVLELGANDGLRGIPVTETRKNLQSIISKVKAKYPQAKLVLAGMQVPPNMGKKYAADFRKTFIDLAQQNNMLFIPFLLEGVGGNSSLNQQDGIHPNAEGEKIVAENVWKVLQGMLE